MPAGHEWQKAIFRTSNQRSKERGIRLSENGIEPSKLPDTVVWSGDRSLPQETRARPVRQPAKTHHLMIEARRVWNGDVPHSGNCPGGGDSEHSSYGADDL